jgi:hypothetical protein
MDPEVKAAWVTALLDGNSIQGTQKLTTVGTDGKQRDCCLGVLCKLAILAGVIPEGTVSNKPTCEEKGCTTCGQYVMYDGEHAFPPIEVYEWAGLVNANPSFYAGDHGYVTLSELNDSGRTFAEIAAVIAREL